MIRLYPALLAPCLALAAAGCTNTRDAAIPMVRMEAETDLKCPSKQIEVRALIGGRYEARGCGRAATYHGTCQHLSCEVGQEGKDARGWHDRPDPGAADDGR